MRDCSSSWLNNHCRDLDCLVLPGLARHVASIRNETLQDSGTRLLTGYAILRVSHGILILQVNFHSYNATQEV